jgi:hypothetical protein
MLVASKCVLVTAGEVRMDLPRQQGILGDIRFPRIIVKGEDQKPCNTNYYAEKGQVWR